MISNRIAYRIVIPNSNLLAYSKAKRDKQLIRKWAPSWGFSFDAGHFWTA